MKLEAKREELVLTAKKAQQAIRKSPQSIRECLKLEVKGQELTVTGMSNEMTIVASMQVTATEDFVVVLDAVLFLNVISKMTADILEIERKDEKSVSVSGGLVQLDMMSMDPEQWPELPDTSEPDFAIDLDNLCESINSCSHALAPNSASNALMSSFNVQLGDGVKVTALDGYRISIRNHLNGVPASDLLLNGDCMKEIVKLVKGRMRLETCGELVKVTGKDIVIYSSMPNGTYFNTESLVKPNVTEVIRVNRQELISALEIATLIDQSITVNVTDALTIACKKAVGNIHSEVTILEQEGTGLQTIGFNGKFLLDALKSIEDEEIRLEFVNELSPVFIRGEDYTELILPVRIAA